MVFAPLFPPEELRAFVARYFGRRERFLEAARESGSPLYLLDESVLWSRARRFREAFVREVPEASFYYAVKSNNHPRVAANLLTCGFGLDVSSGRELETALQLGAGDILFSGPGKTQAELSLAAAHEKQVTVLMDSFGELHRLDEAAAAQGKRVGCGVRLCVNPHGLWRKFGIPLQDLERFMGEAGSCGHVHLKGLQFHTSWNLSPGAQADFLKVLGAALKNLEKDFLCRLEFLDIGGGIWPPQGEWLRPAGLPTGSLEAPDRPQAPAENHYRLPAAPIEVHAAAIGAALRAHIFPAVKCRILMEPGRWICNDAFHLLLSVVDKKARDLVITDAGTNAVGWERFETDYFPILNLTRPSMVERPCHVLGSLCTPHDVWGAMVFGEDVRPGDVLLIPTQGAYTYSLRQDFIKPLPRVHILGRPRRGE